MILSGARPQFRVCPITHAFGKETQKFCMRSIVGPEPSVYGRFGLVGWRHQAAETRCSISATGCRAAAGRQRARPVNSIFSLRAHAARKMRHEREV
ncbi:hypothetical protein SCH4B_0054 [Ruegeria sp. TrichCH4B]|nr:hypothetical protein SCH4B_0054 [Ruegeria sp. TrichCH4B]